MPDRIDPIITFFKKRISKCIVIYAVVNVQVTSTLVQSADRNAVSSVLLLLFSIFLYNVCIAFCILLIYVSDNDFSSSENACTLAVDMLVISVFCDFAFTESRIGRRNFSKSYDLVNFDFKPL